MFLILTTLSSLHAVLFAVFASYDLFLAFTASFTMSCSVLVLSRLSPNAMSLLVRLVSRLAITRVAQSLGFVFSNPVFSFVSPAHFIQQKSIVAGSPVSSLKKISWGLVPLRRCYPASPSPPSRAILLSFLNELVLVNRILLCTASAVSTFQYGRIGGGDPA